LSRVNRVATRSRTPLPAKTLKKIAVRKEKLKTAIHERNGLRGRRGGKSSHPKKGNGFSLAQRLVAGREKVQEKQRRRGVQRGGTGKKNSQLRLARVVG